MVVGAGGGSAVTSERPELVLLPSLNAQLGPGGGLILTQKFLAGVAEYAKYWPGSVTVLVRVDDQPTSDMDRVEIMPGSQPFSIEVRPATRLALQSRLRGCAVVLAFLSRSEAQTVHLCRSVGVPLVYSSEYSLKTECEIIDTQTRNPILRWRRKHWVRGVERDRVEALRHAAGIQCSGTPTYTEYRQVNSNAMLFFDSRVRSADVIGEHELARKCQAVRQGRPLRLAFGGRLIAMKGVTDLPLVAQALSRLGVDFSLDIYGSGELESALRRAVRGLGLENRVRLRGVLDFESGWIPTLKSEVDLFVCCHPQGDPSSTYPEVMACGVPIVGYQNDAFKGIVEHSGAGWLSPVHDPLALAGVLARLHAQRDAIADAAQKARRFAVAHTFELTFANRASHLLQASRTRCTPSAISVKRCPRSP